MIINYKLKLIFTLLVTFVTANSVYGAEDYGISTFKLDRDSKKSSIWVWWLNDHKDVFLSQSGDSVDVTPPPKGYRYCAFQILNDSASADARLGVDYNLDSVGVPMAHYDIPCGGGGVQNSSVTNTAILVAEAVLTYFTGGSLTSILASATVAEFAANAAIYGAISATNNANGVSMSFNSRESNCGVGDAGNWYHGNINVLFVKNYLDCYIPENACPQPYVINVSRLNPDYPNLGYSSCWSYFNNPQPKTINPALPTILSMLLDDSESSSDQTLGILKSGSGIGNVTSSPSGINCGSVCSFSFDQNTNVTLTATPAGSNNVGS